MLAPLLALALGRAGAAELYGLVRVHNMPSLPALVTVNASTGRIAFVDPSGAGQPTTAGTGDLVAIDRSAGRYYYLGDANGTRLVALSLESGKQVCAADVPALQQVQCVGCGQTLSLDAGRNRLLLSGVGANASAGDAYHVLLQAALPPRSSPLALCPAPFAEMGRFGQAGFMPMAHASELDGASNRLYATLSPGAHSYGIGVIDTAESGSDNRLQKFIPESDAKDETMVGMTWIAGAKKLAGVAQDARTGRLDWRTLDPASGAWSSKPLALAPSLNVTLTSLYGNLGSVRTYDPSAEILFVLMVGHSPDSAAELGDGGERLVHVDVRTGTVVAAPLLTGDKGVSGEILLQLAFAGPASRRPRAPGAALAKAESTEPSFGARPVMGWGSYYGYEHDGKETSVTEAMIRGQADNLVSTGLAKAGFRLIFPDDMGFFKRDAATGRLNATTPAFPSGFKALGDHVHGKGLLWGVYSDSGTRTCGPGAGMLGHEEDDAKTFASWGVDHLKVDNCAVPDMDQPPQVRYKKIGDALKRSGRKIVLNMCEWGLNNPAEWGPWAGATSWRVSGDIKWGQYGNFFQSMQWEIRSLKEAAAQRTSNVFADLAGPGAFNDPDELQIGVRPCGDAGARAQYLLWALAKAPLILSAPLTQGSQKAKFGSDEPGLCAEDLKLLLNPGIIAVNQDALSVQGRLLHSAATTPIAIKPFGRIASGTFALLAFLPEQLFIPRNDGRIIGGDGRCLSTDGKTVSVAPCKSSSLGQHFTGAYFNNTNKGTAGNVSIQSIEHPGKCLESHGGAGVTLSPCAGSNAQQKWFVDQHESYIHPQSGSGGGTHAGGSNSGTHALSIAEPIPPEEVWAGPLADGSVAVVLFNRATADNATRNVSVALHRLTNLPGAVNASPKKSSCASVHDVVRQQDVGVVCEPQTVHRMVEPRGAEMLRLTFKSDSQD